MNHYYAFGVLFGEGVQTSNQPYKYNGKELDRMHGLDLFDYGARDYDAAIGRWFTVDPLAEKYYGISSYAYCLNNPIRFIDSDGRRYGDFLDEKGKYIGNDGIDDGKVYVVKTTEKSFDSGVSSAGISKSDAKSTENFIAKNSGNTEAFQNNSIAEEWKPTTSRQKTWILTAKPFLSIRAKATKTALYR